ncbi:hypothetical protein Cob_v010677 [Colletotrichum orbiculare MAFF 240422]|uniref:Uncharacterized protein n=1 Tax=Colletotrichum orbiculare (strain 104-T / ATCC 96160 / CBS 514.97 / LARS 414 / MAFF 240422) TaxID=1213857 RepID=N4VB20_COLOR|nr:hypothetical protein Cob_v010677 [Colletotrichum orbiculare MAFF 240422]
MAMNSSSTMFTDNDRQRLLYEPIVLEYALQMACRGGRRVFNELPAVENDSLATQAQAFHCFVDKLAQVCDNERGGDTVTACAILKTPQGPEFILASNGRDEDKLQEVKEFAESLLDFASSNPLGLSQKPLVKQVLWRILRFNLPRVAVYLDKVAEHLDACIADCERRQKTKKDLIGSLESLKLKVEFPRDIASGGIQDKFLSDCEKLLRAILAMKGTPLDRAIRDKAKEGEMTSSEPWCELRHYLGRLFSFRQAAHAIVGATDRFSEMFKDITVTTIPPSALLPKPIARSPSLTAAAIIMRMEMDEGEQEHYLEEAHEMETLFDVNRLIQCQVGKRTFRPRVHAEVLVHDHVLSRIAEQGVGYWNSWKYIGSSKPTCRLCHYYFSTHPDHVQVRKTHYNLYPNWCLPGFFPRPESATMDPKTLHILQQVTERVQDDARKTLDDKRPLGKGHDSNTYTTQPPEFRNGYSDSLSMSDMASQLPRSIARAGLMGEAGDEDRSSIIGHSDATSTVVDDEEGGGVEVAALYE